jgi:hypothetical protein
LLFLSELATLDPRKEREEERNSKIRVRRGVEPEED